MSSKKKRHNQPVMRPYPANTPRAVGFRELVSRYGVLVALLTLTTAASFGLGPAWGAHFGHGTPGTWTATSDYCNKGCELLGTFTPASASAPSIEEVGIGTGAQHSSIGDSQPAVEVSGNIYPVGGGNDWIGFSVCMLVGIAGLATWIWFAVRRYRRRRAA